MKLTKHQIIDETVKYYSNNPRSIGSDSTCVYNGPNGEKCAFSRCCTDNSEFKEGSGANTQNKAVLLPQYAHYPIEKNEYFWRRLQELHDVERYWDKGLTPEGMDYVKILKEKFND
jgi:hypothetical protein